MAAQRIRKPRQRLVRGACLAIAAGAHLLLWVLLMRPVQPQRASDVESDTRPIYLVFAPPRPAAAAAATAAVASAVGVDAQKSATAVTQSTLQPSVRLGGSTDWYRQAEETAATVAAQITRTLCPPGTHRDAPGKECRANKRSFEWNPEEERAGFAGGLPFVRLGRCMITVGFFGCALGAPPEPNSHLFDDMNDPDRDRNSVPDISEFQRTR